MKIRVLGPCLKCEGKAYLPKYEDVDSRGRKYERHLPCPHCEGTGKSARWIEIVEFLDLLNKSRCPHEHTSAQGGFHLTAGDVWDDIKTVCSDCGELLI